MNHCSQLIGKVFMQRKKGHIFNQQYRSNKYHLLVHKKGQLLPGTTRGMFIPSFGSGPIHGPFSIFEGLKYFHRRYRSMPVIFRSPCCPAFHNELDVSFFTMPPGRPLKLQFPNSWGLLFERDKNFIHWRYKNQHSHPASYDYKWGTKSLLFNFSGAYADAEISY